MAVKNTVQNKKLFWPPGLFPSVSIPVPYSKSFFVSLTPLTSLPQKLQAFCGKSVDKGVLRNLF